MGITSCEEVNKEKSWSCFEKLLKGDEHNGGGLGASALSASSFSEYGDFDNIFAPRKIATVVGNIGSVRLRLFKFQWQ